MFEIHFIVTLNIVNIGVDTKITEIGAFITELQANAISMAAILNFEFSAGKRKATSWFQPFFLNQHTQKTKNKKPRCKFLCFYPEVHDVADK